MLTRKDWTALLLLVHDQDHLHQDLIHEYRHILYRRTQEEDQLESRNDLQKLRSKTDWRLSLVLQLASYQGALRDLQDILDIEICNFKIDSYNLPYFKMGGKKKGGKK